MIIKKTIDITVEELLHSLTEKDLPLVIATLAEKFNTKHNIDTFSKALSDDACLFLAAAIANHYARRK
jgi:hypothetical protein